MRLNNMILLIIIFIIFILGIFNIIKFDINNMREERKWVGWQFKVSKFNMFCYRIGL